MGEPFDPYHKWLGIRPVEQPPDHYRLLGITTFEDDPDVIENAAVQRTRHLRDYQSGPHSDDCQDLLNLIAAAKLCLLDPERRAAYDLQLRSSRSRTVPETPATPPPVAEDSPPILQKPPPVAEAWEEPTIKHWDWLYAPRGAVAASLLFVAAVCFLVWFSQSEEEPARSVTEAGPTLPSDELDVRTPSENLNEESSDVTDADPVMEPRTNDDLPPVESPPAVTIANVPPHDTAADTPAVDLGETPISKSENAVDQIEQTLVYLRQLDTVETDIPKHELQEREIVVDGRTSPNAIRMRPHILAGKSFVSKARFTLEKAPTRRRHLFGAVGFVDPPEESSGLNAPLRFEISGDGDVLWRSRALRLRGSMQPFSIDITGILVLELSLRSNSSESEAGVWIEPRFVEHAGKVDLLRLIDPQYDARHGEWKFENGSLMSPASVNAQLSVPFVAPAEYQLEMVAARESGNSVSVGLVAGERKFNAAFDVLAGADRFSGLMLVDGKRVQENRSSFQGSVLKDGEAAKIKISVRRENVKLGVDGSRIQDWKGDFKRLSLFDGWLPGEPGELFIGSDNAAIRIVKFDLLPFPGNIDLLEWIDPDRDGVRGEFALTDAQFVFPNVKQGQFKLPCRVPENYLLTVAIQNDSRSSIPQIDLVVAGRRASLVLDGYGVKCGIEDVDGRSYFRDDGNATTFAGPVLNSGDPTLIACKVFGRRLQVFAAGKLILDWNGDPRRLPNLVGSRYIGLSNWSGGYRVSKLELQPLLNDIDIKELVTATALQRHSIPAADLQLRAEREIGRLLAKQFAEATTIKLKADLAERLLENARQSDDDLAEQFVLLTKARDLAAEIGYCTTLFQTIDLMAQRFQVDALPMKAESLGHSIDKAKGNHVFGSIALAAITSTDKAVASDRYDLAMKLARTAMTTASKSRMPHLREMADAKREEVEHLLNWWRSLEENRATLAKSSHDSDARTSVGKFLCFAKRDWKSGLDLLASTKQAGLKDVVTLELAEPRDVAELTHLGDAWWSLSSKASTADQPYYQLRCRHWYQRAVDESHGVGQLRIEEFIRKIDRDVLGSERFYLTDMQELNTRNGPWGLGKYGRLGSVERTDPIVIQGVASPHGLGMHPSASGFAFAQYRLDGQFTSLVASAVIEGQGAKSLVTFFVYGDGKPLWQSSPMQKGQEPQRFVVRVRNIKLLELRTHVDGSRDKAHACWLEPFLLKSTPPRGLVLP